jgi:hypothetical protein
MRAASLLFFCICVSSAAWPVRAQVSVSERPQPNTPPPAAGSLADSLTGEARSDYDAGRILFDDEDYAGAFVKFERAFERAHDERLLWNMAACQKNLRHYGSALGLLERYRREGEVRMSDSQRAEVQTLLDTLRTLISTVHLVVNERDASVFVDERPAGTTPLPGPLFVDLGNRRIRVSKPGFQDQVVTQEFTGGSQLTLLVTLPREENEGRISIMAGAGDTIHVDGQIVGQAQWRGSLPAGEHSLRVTAPDMLPYAKEIVVKAGEERTLYVRLDEAAGGGIPAWVWLGAGVLVAGGAAAGAYFLFKPSDEPTYTVGTLDPGAIHLP